MTEEQKLCFKAQGFKEDVKLQDVCVINAVDNKLYAYKIGRYDGYLAGYLECQKNYEWHEELPKEDIRLAIIEVEDCGYLLCEYRNSLWYDKGSSAVCKDWITRNIKRWKEIVLPNEE